MASVLVVDDEPATRTTIGRFLERDGHRCRVAEDARSAIEVAASETFDVVVTDIAMPGPSGLDLVNEVRRYHPGVRFVLITGDPTVETAAEAVRAGAFDYLPKPVTRSRLTAVVDAAARAKRNDEVSAALRKDLEREVVARTRSLMDALERLDRALENTATALTMAMEKRDPYTAGHQRRVMHVVCAIGKKLGLPAEQIEVLRLAAMLHDLGKLSVPAEILSKPSHLTAAEMAIIREHPAAAWEILGKLDLPEEVSEAVLQHHERLDGSGYPRGLKGDDIRIEARILAVADVLEAMSSHRPYRPALGINRAIDHLVAERGRQFDPDVVDACAELVHEGLVLPA